MITKNDYELYFLNDLYDDEIISDSIDSFRNRLYNDILRSKKYIQNNYMISGSIKDIVSELETNTMYGMTKGSYCLKFDHSIIPHFSEEKFLNHYEYEKPITTTQIMEDGMVFTKSMYLFINNHYILDASIVVRKNACLIFIPISDENNNTWITKEYFEEILKEGDGTWSLLFGSKSDFYYGYQQRSILIRDNKLYVSTLQSHKIYNKPVKNNHWTLYLSDSTFSPNVMSASGTYLQSDQSGEYFVISDKFKEYINNAGALKCLVVNEPECTGNGIYLHSQSQKAIFQIPYLKNPVVLDNIIVWRYDNDNDRKLHPIVNTASLQYPNIYDFSSMTTENTNLYIEWIEPIGDNSEYDSYIQDYIDCYGESYANMVINDTVHPLVKAYKPINDSELTTEDYMKSEYRGDYRAWRLSKFIKLLKDNPHRYDRVFEKIYQKNKKFISRSYTYTNSKHIYERSVMNNLDHCGSADENAMYFHEPHTYIKFYNAQCRSLPCTLFINGVRKPITYIMNYGCTLYVYFPVSYIANKEPIQLDTDLDVDTEPEFRSYYMGHLKEDVDLEEKSFTKKNSLSNLLLFLDDTGEYIGLDKFNIILQTSLAKIAYNGWDNTDWVSAIYTNYELYENQLKLFVPTDANAIILKVDEVDYEVKNKGSQKKIDLRDIELDLLDESLFDKKIMITNSNQRYTATGTIDDSYKATKGDIITIPNYKGKPEKSRFHIYFDGVLINPNDYTVSFKGYQKNVVIAFQKGIPTGKFVIDILSYDEDVVYNGTLKTLNKANNILHLRNILKAPFNSLVYKVYVDGYRIPNDYLKLLGQGNLMVISSSMGRTISNSSNVIILKQSMDSNPYEYTGDLQFLDTVIVDDTKFSNYVINKYIL